jgi:hypothetical protein
MHQTVIATLHQQQLGDAAVSKYMEEGVVCPAVMRKGLFTTAAMDNIDHNPTATTATTSFHGTSISLFQHLSTDNEGEKHESIRIKDSKVKRVPELPDSLLIRRLDGQQQ